MDNEIESIEKNKTWELTTLPREAKRIGVKWIYKAKINELREIEKHKARLVAKGYSQKEGIDYKEVFASVARWDSVRCTIALAALNGWSIYQLDVKSAFLPGELSDTLYVDQPLGYVKKGEEYKLYKLHKALYGLKQVPHAWYSKIEQHFGEQGFAKCPYEHTLFVKINKEGKVLIASHYGDDLISTENDPVMFKEFKQSMMKSFDMTDLGKMKHFISIEVDQNC